jgi:hypothetical protein
MAPNKKSAYVAPALAADEVEKFYLIVNPHGAMHVVSEDLARARLKLPGWRLASADEKAAYKKADGNQRAGRPLAKPFSPSREIDDALPMDAEIKSEE